MSLLVNRRRFMQASSSTLAVDALFSTAIRTSAQSLGELRVLVGGGDLGKANIEAYVKQLGGERTSDRPRGTGTSFVSSMTSVSRLLLEVRENSIGSVGKLSDRSPTVFSSSGRQIREPHPKIKMCESIGSR